MNRIKACWAILRGRPVLYRTEGVAALARAVALLALRKPGGVDLFGRHWEYRR